MNILKEKLLLIEGPIKGVIKASAYPFAKVLLLVKFGKKPFQVELMVEFLVIKFIGACNVLIGMIAHNALKVVVLLYHQAIKFPTFNGISVVRGNKKIAWEYYLTKTNDLRETIILISSLDVRMHEGENEQMNPIEALQQVILVPYERQKVTNIEAGLSKELQQNIVT